MDVSHSHPISEEALLEPIHGRLQVAGSCQALPILHTLILSLGPASEMPCLGLEVKDEHPGFTLLMSLFQRKRQQIKSLWRHPQDTPNPGSSSPSPWVPQKWLQGDDMFIPAQAKTETSSNFPAENSSGAGPQCHPCHLQGGKDILLGMDGWKMAPVTSKESSAREKEATGWESMPAEAEGRFFCRASPSAPWGENKEGFSWHFRGWGDSASLRGADRQQNSQLDSF